MSTRGHRPEPKLAMCAAAPDNCIHKGAVCRERANRPGDGEHLDTIHELVQSGDYHVPAHAIADRMIERLIVDKRGRNS